jgi:hypothetical protein
MSDRGQRNSQPPARVMRQRKKKLSTGAQEELPWDVVTSPNGEEN